MTLLVKSVVVAISMYVFLKIFFLYQKLPESLLQTPNKLRLIITGFIANIADTLGLGNFAVVVAFNKNWKLIDDKKLPGTLNGHSILPAMVQSLLFLKFVDLDILTLIVLVLGACVGSLYSSHLVVRLNKQTIRLAMSLGFFSIGLLIFANQMGFLPLAGKEIALGADKLSIGFFAMIFAGMVPSIGVGIYAPIQVILFFLGLSPLVAFPIMTTAGAIVQSMTALTFTTNNEIELKETLLLTFSGIIGVAVAVPFITYVNLYFLRWGLFSVVIYNAATIWHTYHKEKTSTTNP